MKPALCKGSQYSLGIKSKVLDIRDANQRAGERGQGLSREALRREALVYECSLLLPSVISQCIQV